MQNIFWARSLIRQVRADFPASKVLELDAQHVLIEVGERLWFVANPSARQG